MMGATLDIASNTTATECPSCRGTELRLRGTLPYADHFAGQDLPTPMPGGRLYECCHCSLNFRWPRLSKTEADALYSDGADENWNSPAKKRPDWKLAGDWIAELRPGQSILDIACFDGRFLGSLADHHQRYGIEIHKGAAERARQRGVQIIASDLADMQRVEKKFSVITAFDILEHVHSPEAFLGQMSDALQPGGLAIVGTGNTDSRAWQFMGTNYWYCSLMEHISFINPDWCRMAARNLNLEVARLAQLSHCYPTLSKICRETTLNVLHRVSPHYSSLVRYHYRSVFKPHKRKSRHDQPVWFSAKDHLLVAFRKPPTPGSGLDQDVSHP